MPGKDTSTDMHFENLLNAPATQTNRTSGTTAPSTETSASRTNCQVAIPQRRRANNGLTRDYPTPSLSRQHCGTTACQLVRKAEIPATTLRTRSKASPAKQHIERRNAKQRTKESRAPQGLRTVSASHISSSFRNPAPAQPHPPNRQGTATTLEAHLHKHTYNAQMQNGDTDTNSKKNNQSNHTRTASCNNNDMRHSPTKPVGKKKNSQAR